MYGEVRQVLHPRARGPHCGVHHPGLRGVGPPVGLSQRCGRRPASRGEGPQIKVSWDPDSLNTYKTSLDLIAKDRPGLAMDVTTVMATAKMNILGMTVNVLPDGYTKMNLVVEVRTQSEVTTIMNKLNQVQGVYQVSRVSG